MNERVFAGRYQVLEKIGTGGMAEVFKAQDETLGRAVAVKTMLPQYAADTTFTARFRQEAQAAANLSSPYIVNIYDWGKDDDTYYIVMEYVRGVDLKTAIEQRGAINQRKVAEIGSQVCSALSVAHRYDIIHRDIKPQNIMIQPDGNAKVMDFGIARAGNTNLTTTNSVLGTAHYVSPEQAQGKKLTAASDLYSLGIVLYEASTGKLPFSGPDAISVAMKQVNEAPVPPREINPDIDPALEAIILHAMEKKPEDRFASAIEMRDALNAFLAGKPIVLTNAEIGSEAATTVINRNSAPTTVMAEAPRTTVMPVMTPMPAPKSEGTYTDWRSRGNTYEAKNQQVGQKSKAPLIIAIIAILAAAGIILAVLALSHCTGTGAGTTVPDVVGQASSTATKTLEGQGFVVSTDYATSDTVTKGDVISQDPVAGSKAKSGSTVKIVISSGAKIEKTTVPDLSNKTATEAEALLTKANLKYATGADEYSDTIAVGHVVRQDVAANTSVDEGTTVTFYVSKGAQPIEVPDLFGTYYTDAETSLTGLKLTYTEVWENNDDWSWGYVIAQTPAAKQTLTANGAVTLTISSGPEQITVPTIDVGTSVTDAENALSNAGLDYTTNYVYNDAVVADAVISIDPAGGTSVNKGTTITITVSKGSEPVQPSSPTSGSGTSGTTPTTTTTP